MINYTEANREKIRRVAEILQGSRKGLDDVLQEVFEDEDLDMMQVDLALLRELDDQVMECDGCGWWCETGELDDDQVCGDCR